MSQLTKEQIEANLQEKTGRLPGEDTKHYVLRMQNQTALNGKERREAQTQVTREQLEARIAGYDAKRALARDAEAARQAEQAKLAAENPFKQILESDSVTLSKQAKKRFTNLAQDRDERNAAEKAERERIEAIQASPAYQLAVKQAGDWVSALPDEFKQQARNNQAILAETYDVDAYNASTAELVRQARASIDASVNGIFDQQRAIGANLIGLSDQQRAIDALSPPEQSE